MPPHSDGNSHCSSKRRSTAVPTGTMVSGTPRGGGGSGGGGGGPCVRFEGITLELSSFSGCQFDFGKNGNLVLTFEAFTGTVTLQSPSHSTPKMRGDAGERAVHVERKNVGAFCAVVFLFGRVGGGAAV